MSGLSLGLDAGGSATRWALCDAAGAVVARGELPAASGHLFDPAAASRLRAMAAALGAAVAGYGLAGGIAGVTGLSADTAEAAEVAAVLAAAVGVAPAAIRVHDDLWIAYHAAFRPGAGHLVYCGTGSIGLHVRADGGVVRVGGRGMLIDDGGSAFWIGREALRLVWRRADATGTVDEAPLARALTAAIGSAAWPDVRRHVYGGGRDAVAQLARAVAEAAHAGDADALGVLAAAGRELAGLVAALVGRVGVLPVAVAGRAAGLHPALLAAMPGARLAEIDAAAAAARLHAGVHENMHAGIPCSA